MAAHSIPQISVLPPVFNGQSYVREAIESVLSQSGADFELLAGDDGSTDRSREILSAIKDPRVRVFLFEKNGGLFGNLNRLLGKARGALVHFLCQDDCLNPGCLSEEVEFFNKHSSTVMSICQVVAVNNQGEVVGQWQTGGEPVVYERSIGLQLFLYHGCVAGNLSTVCVRREYIDALGGFNEAFRLSGDYEMWVRLCVEGRLADLQKPLIRMREHRARLSLSPGAGVVFVRENREIRRRLLPLLPESVRSYARRYVYLRQNVLDTHHMVTCLRRGKVREVRDLLRCDGRPRSSGGAGTVAAHSQ